MGGFLITSYLTFATAHLATERGDLSSTMLLFGMGVFQLCVAIVYGIRVWKLLRDKR